MSTPQNEAPSDDETTDQDSQQTEREPTTEELEEPSTEKEPGDEPKAPDADPEPSHRAVGIGVVGGPQTIAGEDDATA